MNPPPTAQEAREALARNRYQFGTQNDADSIAAYIDHAEEESKQLADIIAAIDDPDRTPLEWIQMMEDESVLHGNAVIDSIALKQREEYFTKEIAELKEAMKDLLSGKIDIIAQDKPAPDEWEYFEKLQMKVRINSKAQFESFEEGGWKRIHHPLIDVIRSESDCWKRVETKESAPESMNFEGLQKRRPSLADMNVMRNEAKDRSDAERPTP